MENKTRIDGIYFSKEVEDAWIIKIDGECYLAQVHPIVRDNLKNVGCELDERLMRPVGENVERLLLNNSDMEIYREQEQTMVQNMNMRIHNKGKSH